MRPISSASEGFFKSMAGFSLELKAYRVPAQFPKAPTQLQPSILMPLMKNQGLMARETTIHDLVSFEYSDLGLGAHRLSHYSVPAKEWVKAIRHTIS